MISGVSTVVIAVAEVEAAIRFWVDTMGFELVADRPGPDGRWVEIEPPDHCVRLVLKRRSAASSTASDRGDGPRVFFSCRDLARTMEELSRRGVTFDVEPPPEGSRWSVFTDPEGHRYGLIEPGTIAAWTTREP